MEGKASQPEEQYMQRLEKLKGVECSGSRGGSVQLVWWERVTFWRHLGRAGMEMGTKVPHRSECGSEKRGCVMPARRTRRVCSRRPQAFQTLEAASHPTVSISVPVSSPSLEAAEDLDSPKGNTEMTKGRNHVACGLEERHLPSASVCC